MKSANQPLDVLDCVLAANIPILLFIALCPQAKNWLTEIFATAAQYIK